MSNLMINRRLLERRNQLNVSQFELAELSDLSQSQISRYELGTNEPTADALIALAKALNVSTDYLLGLTDSQRQPPQSLTGVESEMISLLRGMTEKQIDQMIQIAKVLLG
jgi:transcriptional regulator with XRE-family HTH domain